MNYLNNNMFDLSRKVLDFLWQKQTITANNIANVDTPGFKAQYVTFEDTLRRALSSEKGSTAAEIGTKISQINSQVHTTQTESARLDENNVNVDVESMELAKSALQYQFLTKSLNDDISRLSTVIRG